MWGIPSAAWFCFHFIHLLRAVVFSFQVMELLLLIHTLRCDLNILMIHAFDNSLSRLRALSTTPRPPAHSLPCLQPAPSIFQKERKPSDKPPCFFCCSPPFFLPGWPLRSESLLLFHILHMPAKIARPKPESPSLPGSLLGGQNYSGIPVPHWEWNLFWFLCWVFFPRFLSVKVWQ